MALTPHQKTEALVAMAKKPTPGEPPEVGTAHVEHPFTPDPDRPWERCTVCKLAESAHLDVRHKDSYENHMLAIYGGRKAGHDEPAT